MKTMNVCGRRLRPQFRSGRSTRKISPDASRGVHNRTSAVEGNTRFAAQIRGERIRGVPIPNDRLGHVWVTKCGGGKIV